MRRGRARQPWSEFGLLGRRHANRDHDARHRAAIGIGDGARLPDRVAAIIGAVGWCSLVSGEVEGEGQIGLDGMPAGLQVHFERRVDLGVCGYGRPPLDATKAIFPSGDIPN